MRAVVATEQDRDRQRDHDHDRTVALHEEVRALRAVFEEYTATLPVQIKEEVAEVTVPREEFNTRIRASGRRSVAAMVLLLVVIVAAVSWNRVTLRQAQEQAIDDFRHLVVTCRTTGPPLSRQELAFCEHRVPGFTAARKRVAATLEDTRRNQRRLADLERWAKARGWHPPT